MKKLRYFLAYTGLVSVPVMAGLIGFSVIVFPWYVTFAPLCFVLFSNMTIALLEGVP